MRVATPLEELTEKEWQTQVIQLASTLGWRKAYHTYDSRRSHSGFPDLVLVRDRVIFVELKREKGKVSDAQAEWLIALNSAGAEVYVWYPSDLDEIAGILATRKKTA